MALQFELASLPWTCAVCDGQGRLLQTNLTQCATPFDCYRVKSERERRQNQQ